MNLSRGLSCALLLVPIALSAQHGRPVGAPPESMTVAVGAQYQAGGFHQFMFGGAYRDLWLTPIRVPVLNLRNSHGGLIPLKEGGGFETKSLRFTTSTGAEYVFRSMDKGHGNLPGGFSDIGLVNGIVDDQNTAKHPAASVIVPELLRAAGVLHSDGVIVVMPDDSLLGKFRKDFGNRLGVLQPYPNNTPGHRAEFGGAVEIIDSDSLLQWLNRDPREVVDARAFLAARLMDMLVNNWDRHPGQWKWARLEHGPDEPWEPISRDYDRAFVSTNGLLPGLARQALPNLVAFEAVYPSMHSLTWNSLGLDQRLLNGLSKQVWDSVARSTSRRITDAEIRTAVGAMPVEYRASAPSLISKLQIRRDSLIMIADRFYNYLAGAVDIHGTDGADRATVTRLDDQHVEVRLQSTSGKIFYQRSFDARETASIRVYLHGGDDRAVVLGNVRTSIPVWIDGGNGTNTLTDSSRVAGRTGTAQLFDNGKVTDVKYGTDTLFNRRPLVKLPGGEVELPKDFGSAMSPEINLSQNHDYGIQPELGLTWRHYGVRDAPYSSMIALTGRYSTKVSGTRITLTADKRLRDSPFHLTLTARTSQLELINYHGQGNSSPQSPGRTINVSAPRTDYYAVSQRQLLLQPAVALALGHNTNLSLGPIHQSFVTDSTPERFISTTRPYGFGHFTENGVRLGFLQDYRTPYRHPREGTLIDVSATYYPASGSVLHPFEVLSATAGAYVTVGMPLHPSFGLHANAKKVYGEFPFEESAFVGGRSDVRVLDPQRYAGDASVAATAEVRVPVAKFTIIAPLNTGLFATQDIGRVYVKGASPGGWHNAFGAGFWVGFQEHLIDIRFYRRNEAGRPAATEVLLGFSGAIR